MYLAEMLDPRHHPTQSSTCTNLTITQQPSNGSFHHYVCYSRIFLSGSVGSIHYHVSCRDAGSSPPPNPEQHMHKLNHHAATLQWVVPPLCLLLTDLLEWLGGIDPLSFILPRCWILATTQPRAAHAQTPPSRSNTPMGRSTTMFVTHGSS